MHTICWRGTHKGVWTLSAHAVRGCVPATSQHGADPALADRPPCPQAKTERPVLRSEWVFDSVSNWRIMPEKRFYFK